MTDNTKAYDEFLHKLDRIREIRIHAESLPRNRVDSILDQHICGGALLLLCGNLEVFFVKLSDILFEKIQKNDVEINQLPDIFIYYMLKHKIDPLIIQYNKNEDNKNKKMSKYKNLINEYIELYETYNNYKSRNKNLINKKIFKNSNIIEDFSVPTFKKIKNYFDRFGYYEFEHDFRDRYGKDFEFVKGNYNAIIARRHSIAHGETNELITTNILKKNEDDLMEFCNSVDKLFSDWCERKLHCNIRGE